MYLEWALNFSGEYYFMQAMIKIISLLMTVLLFSGCASESTLTPLLGYNAEVLDSSSSRLVIYREPVQEVEDKSPYLYINNSDYGALKNNQYVIVPMEPGRHRLLVKEIDSYTNLYGEDDWPVRPKTTFVNLEPGQEKFIRYTVRINTSVFDWYDAYFEEVPRNKALIDLDFMRKQPAE